jgi:hypothetical protein
MLHHIGSRILTPILLSAIVLGVLTPAPTQAARLFGTSPLPHTTFNTFLRPYQLRPANARPAVINRVPIDRIVILSPVVRVHIRALYASGLQKGNNPQSFSTLGDSTVAGKLFMERFSTNKVNLGAFDYLKPALIAFTPSFSRTSASVRIGLHSWTALNPVWANKQLCEPNENGVDCEFRLNKPSILFIHLGANDTANNVFDKNMRKIVEHVLNAGVVPVLMTKAEPPDSKTHANNDSLRAIAKAYDVPLVDFETLANTLPDYGLGPDKVHMTSFNQVDYTEPALFKSGHAMHNLAALIALDAVWRTATTIE